MSDFCFTHVNIFISIWTLHFPVISTLFLFHTFVSLRWNTLIFCFVHCSRILAPLITFDEKRLFRIKFRERYEKRSALFDSTNEKRVFYFRHNLPKLVLPAFVITIKTCTSFKNVCRKNALPLKSKIEVIFLYSALLHFLFSTRIKQFFLALSQTFSLLLDVFFNKWTQNIEIIRLFFGSIPISFSSRFLAHLSLSIHRAILFEFLFTGLRIQCFKIYCVTNQNISRGIHFFSCSLILMVFFFG